MHIDIARIDSPQFKLYQPDHTVIHNSDKFGSDAFADFTHFLHLKAPDTLGLDEKLIGNRLGTHDTPRGTVVRQLGLKDLPAFSDHRLKLLFGICHNSTLYNINVPITEDATSSVIGTKRSFPLHEQRSERPTFKVVVFCILFNVHNCSTLTP